MLDQSIPPIPQATLIGMANALGIQMPNNFGRFGTAPRSLRFSVKRQRFG